MAQESIVAIEIGSHKIAGIAGKKTIDGIQIQAYASVPSSDFVSRGIIQNIDKTAGALTEIVNRLESAMGGAVIKRAYVGISGQSLHSLRVKIEHELGGETQVTAKEIDKMLSECWDEPYQDFNTITASPLEYKINGKLQRDPVGITCSRIEGNYIKYVADKSIIERINRSFEKADIEIADSFIVPKAAAGELLDNKEKELGCALVDIGSNTTTVTIFKNGLLRHLFVIPLGGHNITKDICNEQVSEEEAEALKCNHGYAASANEDGRNYHVNEKRTLSAETLNNIIEARTEEILKNVKHQIEVAGYNELLNSGIIYTGGGSKLKGLKEITTICLPKVEMRIAHRIITPLSVQQGAGFEQDVTTTGVLGLLCTGNENCCEEEKVVWNEEPANTTKETVTPIEDLFDVDEEAARKKNERIAAEKRRKEEEKKRKEEEKEKRRKENEEKRSRFFGGIKDTFSKLGDSLLNNEEDK